MHVNVIVIEIVLLQSFQLNEGVGTWEGVWVMGLAKHVSIKTLVIGLGEKIGHWTLSGDTQEAGRLTWPQGLLSVTCDKALSWRQRSEDLVRRPGHLPLSFCIQQILWTHLEKSRT